VEDVFAIEVVSDDVVDNKPPKLVKSAAPEEVVSVLKLRVTLLGVVVMNELAEDDVGDEKENGS
jgi:hypothetical protein